MALNLEIIRKDLVKLLPASVLEDISCFVFYDNYPTDGQDTDIVICTKSGEVMEFYQRNKLSSIILKCKSLPVEIVIYRQSEGKLFYLVSTGDELFILKKNGALILHKTLTEVSSFEIVDNNYNGFANLKVFFKSDAIPYVYDDNFQCLNDDSCNLNQSHSDDNLPVVIQLKRKLTEARYCVQNNVKCLNEIVNLRQKVAYDLYLKQCLNLKDRVFTNPNEFASSLSIRTRVPWIKAYNQKLIILFVVLNENNVPLEDVNIVLSSSSTSISYITKLFEKTNTQPFWFESQTQELKPTIETGIVAVINVDEFKNNILSDIEFKGMIIYKKENKDCLLPFEDVIISSLDTMGENFDVLATMDYDANDMLAILATTEKVQLCLRHIVTKEGNQQVLDLPELFCSHLQMEKIYDSKNIIIHRKSAYHVLNGLMILFQDNDFRSNGHSSIYVYARTHCQILALIHLIYNYIPHKIIAILPNHKLMAKNEALSHYNEETNETSDTERDYKMQGCAVLKKLRVILEFLDNCMVKMNENKDVLVQSKIGSEIDLFAQGMDKYVDFKDKLLSNETSSEIMGLDYVNINSSGEMEDVSGFIDGMLSISQLKS